MGPNQDQVELVIFGPNYGESILLHIGGMNWIVIDSCLDSEKNEPAALTYLRNIGLNPSDCIKLIIATHWHDDHIAGMSKIVKSCPNSNFCCSAAMTKKEFIAMVATYETRNLMKCSSGVKEIFEVTNSLHGKTIINALADRRIYTLPASQSGHGNECRLTTLSPSDEQFSKFLYEMTNLMPDVNETKSRVVSQAPNHIATVIWIEIGDNNILLGSDLENSKNDTLGWAAIINSNNKPKGKANIFKIPHHGSSNGHNDNVWKQMITKDPIAVLSPYNRGHKLPTRDDVVRITSLADKSYSTATLRPRNVKSKRTKAVEKTIRETVSNHRYIEPSYGWVRIRNDIHNDFNKWEVELFQDAVLLSNFLAA